MAAVDEALAAAGASAGDVERFVHGMTVGTNALLEGRVARTALLATEGFTDLEELGRQARAELYRLCAGHPPPLVPRGSARAGSRAQRARTGCCGRSTRTLSARLSTASTRRRPPSASCGASAIPSTRLGWLSSSRRRAAGIHVSTSHETAGVFREYERCATTVVDAALSPLLRGYLERLTERARDAGLPEPEVMLSSGGIAERRPPPRAHGSWTVLSGPAGRRGRRARGARRGRRRRRRRARHGRHVVRRLADRRRGGGSRKRARGRRAGARAPDGRRAHGRRRRRVDRVARLRRRAAGGTELGGRGPGSRRATAAAATGPR